VIEVNPLRHLFVVGLFGEVKTKFGGLREPNRVDLIFANVHGAIRVGIEDHLAALAPVLATALALRDAIEHRVGGVHRDLHLVRSVDRVREERGADPGCAVEREPGESDNERAVNETTNGCFEGVEPAIDAATHVK